MAVRLVSYSKATDEFATEGLTDLQELIAFCAKVSNPQAQINTETSERLIKYLIKHAHWSPLEMVNATLEIETTRDIAHQIVRHRSFAFQEFSQRYADPAEMGNQFVVREARLQDPKNRQNSVETDDGALEGAWIAHQNAVIARAKQAYEWAIENSWVHYIDLRSANGTQKEHMEIAVQCAKVIAEIFPMANDLSKL